MESIQHFESLPVYLQDHISKETMMLNEGGIIGDEGSFRDLFGALVRRKLYVDSAVYQESDLFCLSLPKLEDGLAPDIFMPPNDSFEMRDCGISEQKIESEITIDISKALDHSINQADTANMTYFSMAPKNTFSAIIPRGNCVKLNIATVSELTLLALKGVPSKVYDLQALVPPIMVQGYSATAMCCFLTEMRTSFVLRCLLNAATVGLSTSMDTAGQALGNQLTMLLHLFDISVTELIAPSAQASECGDTDQLPANTEGCHNALVNIWERTQLHRYFLLHLFTVVRPESCTISVQDAKRFVADSSAATDADQTITALLRPASWSSRGGWALLHRLVQGLNSVRQCAGPASRPEVFQHSLFHNRDAFAPSSATLEIGRGRHPVNLFTEDRSKACMKLSLDYARMVLTATLVRHVSVPLLAQLSDKLFALDADFDATDAVTDSELASSLQISIQALWERYSTRSDSAEEQHQQQDEGEGAEKCVEFLLAALAWSRGRIALMLLESLGTAHSSVTASMLEVGGGRKKPLPVPIRADAPLRVPKGTSQQRTLEGVGVFDRQGLVAEFRSHRPQLLLPLNTAQEQALCEVRSRSDHLIGRLSTAARASMGAWYDTYATMSDYYSEHAVKAKSMFADVDYHIRRPAPAVQAPHLLSTDSMDPAVPANERNINPQKKTEAGTSMVLGEDEVVLTSAVGTARVVPKALIAQAEGKIRARYDTLMQGVTARITATAWRKRQMQQLPEARRQLAALFEEDARALQRLQAAKVTSPDKYRQFLTQQPTFMDTTATVIPPPPSLSTLSPEEKVHPVEERPEEATVPVESRVAQRAAGMVNTPSAPIFGENLSDQFARQADDATLSTDPLENRVARRAAGMVNLPSPPIFDGPTSPSEAGEQSSAHGLVTAVALPMAHVVGTSSQPGAEAIDAVEVFAADAPARPPLAVSLSSSSSVSALPAGDVANAERGASGTDEIGVPPTESGAPPSVVAPGTDKAATHSEPVSELATPPESTAEPSAESLPAPEPEPAPQPEPEPQSSHSLVDLAQPLLVPDNRYLQAEDRAFDAARSLSHTIARLARSVGVLDMPEKEVQTLLQVLQQENPALVQDEGALWTALLHEASKRPSTGKTTLHSLRAVFMRSLGETVLAQCRAINLASMHCLVSGAVDLLGHIKAVDHLFLVSPNSDFLLTLCTGVVDQHLQLMRVLQRQRRSSQQQGITPNSSGSGGSTYNASDATVVSLTHQFSDRRNAELWNAEALQVAFASTMSATTSAAQFPSTDMAGEDRNTWKAYGSQYASLQVAMCDGVFSVEASAAAAPTTTIDELSCLWTAGLFASSGLNTLTLAYCAPWPVPAIITTGVLRQFAVITRRFLELGQLVALFRVVWGEMRLFRVQKARPTSRTMKRGVKRLSTTAASAPGAKAKAKVAEGVQASQEGGATENTVRSRDGRQPEDDADRLLSDALRLVQQAVQTLFDYLSERVYVHQAQFKRRVMLASESGLDGLVGALKSYSDALAASALQLTAEEESVVRQLERTQLATTVAQTTTPNGASRVSTHLLAEDPSVALKWTVNAMLTSCLLVLRHAKRVNDLRAESATTATASPHLAASSVGVEANEHAAASLGSGGSLGTGEAADRGRMLAESVDAVAAQCVQVQAFRADLVCAAQRLSACDMGQGDLQSLIMRFRL